MSPRRGNHESSSVVNGREPDPLTRGALVAIGGAEDKVGGRAILSQLVAMAGGDRATIALFPTGSQIPDELDTTYRAIFERMGAEVRTVHVRERSDARLPTTLRALDGATAAFFTGGAQGRIVSLLGGTPLAQAVRRAHRDGMIVAGTSAGASVICQHMIAQGRAGYAPRRSSVTMAPGLGLTKRLVIDQHFAQRHRIGRLFAAVALNPFLIGVGIDENTAIVLDAKNCMRVIGAGTVTVIDGSGLVHTDIHETANQAPAAVLGLAVHVLTDGHGYDADRRVVMSKDAVCALGREAESANAANGHAAARAHAREAVLASASATNGGANGRAAAKESGKPRTGKRGRAEKVRS